MTPMRFSVFRSTTLAAALGFAAALVASRVGAADAPTNPPPAVVTNAPAGPAIVAETKEAAATNSTALPVKNEQAAENPPSPSPTNPAPAILDTNAPAAGVGQSVTNPLPSAPAAIPVQLPGTALPRSSATPARDGKSTPADAAPRIDFSTFKILGERNIFDPNRSSRGSRYVAPSSDTPPPRRAAPTSVEAFSLVGTLAYGDNQMAFIDGGSTQFKKALRLNDTVAGLKLKSVATSQATFDNDGAELAVRIGQGLRREDRGAWTLNTQPASYAAAPLLNTNAVSGTNATTATEPASETAAPAAPGTVAAKPEPAPTGAEAEALRRLLEKRRKEEEK